MTAFVQHGLDHAAGGFVVELFPDGIGGGELGHVQHGIRVAGEHAGAGCTVHAALAALGTFAVVMGVNYSTIQFMAYLIELAAELRHLLCRVFITGQHLIDRVEDDCREALLLCPAN